MQPSDEWDNVIECDNKKAMHRGPTAKLYALYYFIQFDLLHMVGKNADGWYIGGHVDHDVPWSVLREEVRNKVIVLRDTLFNMLVQDPSWDFESLTIHDVEERDAIAYEFRFQPYPTRNSDFVDYVISQINELSDRYDRYRQNYVKDDACKKICDDYNQLVMRFCARATTFF